MATPKATVHGSFGKKIFEEDILVIFIYKKSRLRDIIQGLSK